VRWPPASWRWSRRWPMSDAGPDWKEPTCRT
jgi:hypothetical protein